MALIAIDPVSGSDPSGLFGGLMQPSYGAYEGGVSDSSGSGGASSGSGAAYSGSAQSNLGTGLGWMGNPNSDSSPLSGGCNKNDGGDNDGPPLIPHIEDQDPPIASVPTFFPPPPTSEKIPKPGTDRCRCWWKYNTFCGNRCRRIRNPARRKLCWEQCAEEYAECLKECKE